MSAPLSELSTKTSRKNNFNLIRFFAASLILFSLSYTLKLGDNQADPLYQAVGISWADVGIDIFLIISGFLLTHTYYKQKDPYGFIGNRVLKIMPQLILATVFTVFLVGMAFTELTPLSYLGDTQTLLFLSKNLTLIAGAASHLPATFSQHAITATNGNLWMLSFLVMLYGLLFSLLKLSDILSQYDQRFSAKNIILLLAIDALALDILNHQAVVFSPMITHFIALFTIGASFRLWQDSLTVSSAWIGITLPALMLTTLFPSYFYNVYCLTLPFIIFYIAYIPKGSIRSFNRLGKYAYGLFLYAYPVQQALLAIMPNIPAKLLFVASAMVTFIIAVFTQHLAEQYTPQFKQLLRRMAKFGLRQVQSVTS